MNNVIHIPEAAEQKALVMRCKIRNIERLYYDRMYFRIYFKYIICFYYHFLDYRNN